MSEPREIWQDIVSLLEEKMQYGLLEQAKAIVKVTVDGSELHLAVATDEAYDFFSAEVNQQRLMIVSRAVISIEKVVVEKVEAEPIE